MPWLHKTKQPQKVTSSIHKGGSLKQPIMDKENLYEVNELQQYDVNNGYGYEDDRKPKEQVFAAKGKVCCALIVIAVVSLMTLFLILALLLAVFVTVEDGYTRTSSTTVQSVEGMNCSSTSSEWANRMQEEMNELKQNVQNLQTHVSTLQTHVSTLVNTSVDTAWKIDDIHNFADMQAEKSINNSISTSKILEITGNSASKLINIVNTLSNLQDTSTSTAGVVDDILLIAQELLVLHNDSTALPTSCKEIKERQPLSPSGYYILVALNGGAYETYCNMGTLCSSGGGWTRLAYLDMSDATQNCPSGFRLYQSGEVRACGRLVTNSGSCVSVQFPSNGINYSQICGRVTGYQYYSSDAFNVEHSNNIDAPYVDGVSITRGSPRQHVWTMANDPTDSYTNPQWMCPCVSGSSQTVPSFVGSHYFCESGNHGSSWSQILYTSDPLWDGQGCGSLESPCCNVPGIPWFHRDYGSNTTTDYIELRVCGNEVISNEDSPVGYYEIYIK